MKKHALYGAVVGAFIIQYANADTQVAGEEIIVTATRTAQTTDDVLASVSVITRKDIELSQAESLLELLRGVAGIDIVRTGGPGQITTLFMRGANSEHTLVLIDGVRAQSATTGNFPWEKLSPSQIERIEIVRGPRSTLYGSPAIGGVIHIFTRKDSGTRARIEVGSFGTTGAQASYAAGNKTRFHINVDYRRADGYSATNPNAGFSYNADNDAYDNRSVTLGLQSQVTTETKLNFQAWLAESNTEIDPAGATDSRNHTLSFSGDTRMNASWSQHWTVGNTLDRLNADPYSSLTTTNRTNADWHNIFEIGERNLLTAGLSYIQERGSNINTASSTTVFDNSADNAAAYSTWQSKKGDNTVELGVRLDSHSDFGSHTTGQIAWGRKFSTRHSVFATYGTAFKAPDLNQLYHPGTDAFSPGVFQFSGNAALQPEESESYELGWRLRKSKTKFRISLFHTRTKNLIAYQGTNFQAINIGQSRSMGAEAIYSTRFGPWKSAVQVTLQKADPIDVYAADRAYWRSFWAVPLAPHSEPLMNANER